MDARPERGFWGEVLWWHGLLLKVATSLLYVLFLAIGMLQIVSRYMLNQPITWAEQLSRYMFAWSIFIGAAMVIATGDHIKLDFLTSRMSNSVQKILGIAVSVVTIFMISWLYVYDGFHLIGIVSNQFSPALGIRMTVPYLCVPVGGILIVVSLVLVLINGKTQKAADDLW